MSPKSCVALLVALGACMTSAQNINLGKCDPNIKPMSNFDAAKYLGKWFEQEKYFAIFELGGKCVTAEYSLNDDGTIGVLNKQINSVTNKESSIEGKATFENNDNKVAKLSVKFASVPVAAPYWVLDTDYDNYTVIYSCVDAVDVAKGDILWIMTREQNPDEKLMDKARNVAKGFGLDISKLEKTDQTGCQ